METQTSTEDPLSDVHLVVSDLVFETVKNYMDTKDVRLNLNNNTIYIINRVLEQFPELFQNIDKHINVIIEDGKFDINDVPQIVLMIKDIINGDVKKFKKLKIRRSDAILLIEGILTILIDCDVLKTGNDKDSIKTLLRLCIQILDAGVNLNETITCDWKCCC